ncbi:MULTISPECIES: sulfatase family protein [Rhodopirellula]|uniref:sulfatase family protein n=1 Tax=Rhodopirellula TaxID=265488 RepID=UPI00257F4CCC|nr:sulfatase [Rhodopirellula sp. UBA1907]|tara:strand:+ start:12067 stop:13503 length:1437 start_codon:yes stop_codon:yes gene_type:complete
MKLLLRTIATVFAVVMVSVLAHAETKSPNFLIVMADDCTYNDLPMYGGENAKTPNLERLAKEGMTFDRAFLAEAICQPCRAELYSGLYPMRNGCNWNHSASRGDIESMPQHLSRVGYRVGLAGKVHVSPKSAFPFEMVDGCDKNCVRNPTQEMQLDSIREFMAREDGQPFCLVVALVEPHVPWVMGDASAYPPRKLKLPPNIGDTPETRSAFGRYLAEITYMDDQFGQIMNELDEVGESNDTIVLFTSEQGSQFPGNKWTNYNTGVHTALIAKWPGMTVPGTRTDALVQYADVLPTLMDLAGAEYQPEAFDGSSFAHVLRHEKDAHREYAYGTHNNVPEGPSYPIRSITDGRYHYIRNLQNENLYIEKHLMGIKGNGELNNKYWQTWVFQSFDQPELLRLIHRYQLRPKEELYDLENDPYEMTNLIEDESLAGVREELGRELDRWMQSQGDPGAEQDTTESLRAAKRGEHRFGIGTEG